MKIPPKAHVLKAWSPMPAVFTDGALWKLLNHKAYELIDGLVLLETDGNTDIWDKKEEEEKEEKEKILRAGRFVFTEKREAPRKMIRQVVSTVMLTFWP